MLSVDELRKEADEGTIDTVVTAFTDMQGRLFGKRIQIEYFLDEVTAHLASGDARIAVMFLDLDRFKWINDSLGHPAGDKILVEAAARLRGVLRSRDVLARFGGDEFTILVTDATAASVEAIAQRVEAAFTEPFHLDGGEFFLSISAGIAMADGTNNAYDLVRDADAAMYRAKTNGRARFEMFG